MRVRPSDKDILSFLYSQYHQIYCIFQHIMCTEVCVGELCEKKCVLIILERQIDKGFLNKMLVWTKQTPKLMTTIVTITITNMTA
jgi:hypothetical protein